MNTRTNNFSIKCSIYFFLILFFAQENKCSLLNPKNVALATNFALGYGKRFVDFRAGLSVYFDYSDVYGSFANVPDEAKKYFQKVMEDSSFTQAEQEKIQYKLGEEFAAYRSRGSMFIFVDKESIKDASLIYQRNSSWLKSLFYDLFYSEKYIMKRDTQLKHTTLHEEAHLKYNDCRNDVIAIPISMALVQCVSSAVNYYLKNTRAIQKIRNSRGLFFVTNVGVGLAKYVSLELLLVLHCRHYEKRADLSSLQHLKKAEELDMIVQKWQKSSDIFNSALNYSDCLEFVAKPIPGYAKYLSNKYHKEHSAKNFAEWLATEHPNHYAVLAFIYDPRHPSYKKRIEFVQKRKEDILKEERQNQ